MLLPTPNNAVNPFSFSLGGAFAGSVGEFGNGCYQCCGRHPPGHCDVHSRRSNPGQLFDRRRRDLVRCQSGYCCARRFLHSGEQRVQTAHIASNSTNTGTNTYTLSDLSMDANAEPAAMSYSLDHGNTWIKATAPVVTKSTANSGDLTIGGKYTGLPAYQDLVVTAQAWKVNATITPSGGWRRHENGLRGSGNSSGGNGIATETPR